MIDLTAKNGILCLFGPWLWIIHAFIGRAADEGKRPIFGDFTCFGTNWGIAGFTEATSTVNFNGASLQSITTPGGENFSNLTVNSMGTGLQLGNNVTVATTLTMKQGNIDLNAGKVLTLRLSVANNRLLYLSAPSTSPTTGGTMTVPMWMLLTAAAYPLLMELQQ